MSASINKIKNGINIFLKDKNRKPLFRIFKESMTAWWVKKQIPYFYFALFLYRKGIDNPNDYLSSKQVDSIIDSKRLHRFSCASLLRNKLAFAYHMKAVGIPIPEHYGHNFNNRFVLNGIQSQVSNASELVDFIKKIFDHHNTNKVIIKDTTEMGGYGCFLFTSENLEEEVGSKAEYILNNDCIHQAVIEQHPDVNVMYAHSLNTIRFDTYIDKNGKKHILAAFMRFGVGGHYVDNASSGGVYLGVDLEAGRLRGRSHQLMRYGGKQYDAHPDTGLKFDGWQIPQFEACKDLVMRSLEVIPDRIIGWDVCISVDGPVLIEGNDNNSFFTPDVAYGGYLKHPLFKEVLAEA